MKFSSAESSPVLQVAPTEGHSKSPLHARQTRGSTSTEALEEGHQGTASSDSSHCQQQSSHEGPRQAVSTSQAVACVENLTRLVPQPAAEVRVARPLLPWGDSSHLRTVPLTRVPTYRQIELINSRLGGLKARVCISAFESPNNCL